MNYEKPKKAIALQYKKDKAIAPKLLAKGEGRLAEKIIALAKQYNIEIYEDKDLANILYGLEIDSLIPVEAYVAVAEILSYIYAKNKELRGVIND